MVAPILDAHTTIYSHALEAGDDPGVTFIRFGLRMMKKTKLKNVAKQIEEAQIAGILRIEVYPTS